MKKFEILKRIYENCSLTSKEILVAQYFVYKSDKKGSCYPSVTTIAYECGVSERTVQRATGKLRERGYLSIEKRVVNGRQTSNEYRITTDMPEDDPLSDNGAVQNKDVIEDKNKSMVVISLEELIYGEESKYDLSVLKSKVCGCDNIVLTPDNLDTITEYKEKNLVEVISCGYKICFRAYEMDSNRLTEGLNVEEINDTRIYDDIRNCVRYKADLIFAFLKAIVWFYYRKNKYEYYQLSNADIAKICVLEIAMYWGSDYYAIRRYLRTSALFLGASP